MTALGGELVPTQSVLLELRAESGFVHEGHEFLDQKRILLAGEIQRLLSRYDALRSALDALHARATVALAEASALHGIDALCVYPAVEVPAAAVQTRSADFLGVPLVTEAQLATGPLAAPPADVPSPESRGVRQLFAEMVARAVELAAISGNIQRLTLESVRTERRAKALENVILPELDAAIRRVDDQLAEQQQEDVIRARLRR